MAIRLTCLFQQSRSSKACRPCKAARLMYSFADERYLSDTYISTDVHVATRDHNLKLRRFPALDMILSMAVRE
ncbi:hypothetical protein J1614_008581 [Plenodomus biglobosus]|nr:hypothetical protein J1614_008581 [Plenodomus biglobosus]